MPISLTMAEIEGLQQWIWPARPEWIGGVLPPTNAAEPVGFSLQVPKPITISLEDDIDLRLHFALDRIPSFDGFSARKRITVWIEPHWPQENSDYSKIVIRRLREFMSFVADTDLLIRKAIWWPQDFKHFSSEEQKRKAYENNINLYTPVEGREREIKDGDFFFEFDQDRFPEIIRGWMHIYDENEFALQWWFSNIAEKRSIRYRETEFVAAVIAVESLCRSNYHVEGSQTENWIMKYGDRKPVKIPKLEHLLVAEMKSLGHFGNEDYVGKLARKIAKFRGDEIVHQYGSNSFLRLANPSEFTHLHWTVCCLFKLMILTKLGFNFDERAEIISRTQNLNGFLWLPDLDKLEERIQE